MICKIVDRFHGCAGEAELASALREVTPQVGVLRECGISQRFRITVLRPKVFMHAALSLIAGYRNKSFGQTIVLLFLLSSGMAAAGTLPEEYSKLIKSAEVVKSEGPDLFGDAINLYNGSTEFSVTDVDLPGSNALRVGIGRKYSVGNRAFHLPFGRWDMDIPYIGGIFTHEKGWVLPKSGDPVNSNPNRCSAPTTPESARPVSTKAQVGSDFSRFVEIWKIWNGYQLFTPDGGMQEVLFATADSNPKPADGLSYKWLTKGFWYLSCLPTLKSGNPGEGFLAHSPDGTKYYLDWMVTRSADSILQPVLADGTTLNANLPRDDIRIYPTRVEDRFGNWVQYTWDQDQLKAITSSDGRTLTLTWEQDSIYGKNRIAKITTGAQRSWLYGYNAYSSLTSVTLPDSTSWSIDLAIGTPAYDETQEQTPDGRRIPVQDKALVCGWMQVLRPLSQIGTIKHPSGAVGEFEFRGVRHSRSQVPQECLFPLQDQLPEDGYPDDVLSSLYPARSDVMSIRSKKISGAGLPSSTWNYAYVAPLGGWAGSCAACPSTKSTTVTGPDGTRKVYTYGMVYNENEGQMLKAETLQGSTVVRTETYTYPTNAQAASQPFSDRIGISPQFRQDSFSSERLRPLLKSVTTQSGVDFSLQTTTFNAFAKPLSVAKSSSLGYSKTETTAYADNLAKWVLGQVAKTTVNGIVASETGYDTLARPITQKAFGKLQQTLTYNADGTLATVKDGRNSVTTLSSWKRGIPQKITFPATTDQPTAVSKSAVVNDDGTIASVTDENGFATKYGYDAMGRLASIDYPDSDSVAWANTTISFQGGYQAAYGLPAGHWRQRVLTGKAVQETLYDALWRPVVTQHYDNTSTTTIGATLSQVITRYDSSGRVSFQSYPQRVYNVPAVTDTWANPAVAPNAKGTNTAYDALDRVTTVKQDSELGVLTTKTDYLSGLETRITDPKGHVTQTRYIAYDDPATAWPNRIIHPEGAYTYMARDVFGKPTALIRQDVTGGNALTRNYVYNANQELCKTVEPETGATITHRDGAGNVDWTAAGLTLTSPTACQDADAPSVRKVVRTYDARNRVKTLAFSNGQGDQTWTYTPDSLIATTTADNPNVATPSKTTYTYNRRRLLAREALQPLGGTLSWPITYGYNANGHAASLTYPTGLSVAYTPNALGQATQVGTYATGIGYHPNGAIKQFSYGNGITHTLTQNLRQLPDTSCDSVGACGATSILNDGYDYDANGNVAAISDGRTGNRGNRTMTYDGLDRLTATTSPMFGTGAAYSYDIMDNLTRVRMGATPTGAARDQFYCYDSTWHLTNIKTGSCSGTTVMGLGYDALGNLNNKNGAAFAFDYGNRLRTSPGTWYAYDGLGRRILSCTSGACVYQLYSQGGQLIYTDDKRTETRTEYIHLAGSLLAERKFDLASSAYSTRYQHTDALGSPVAVTSDTRAILEKNEYEPYGRVLNHATEDGPGYTGHATDAATGLVYMQQRYFDPTIPRFLSADPVAADGNTGANFNRYKYANNNPYKFTDLDGRQAKEVGRWARALWDNNGDFEKAKSQVDKQHQMDLKVADIIVDFTAGGVVKDAVEVSIKVADGNDATGKGTGAIAGEVAGQVTEAVLNGKIGDGPASVVGAAVGKATGDAIEAVVDHSRGTDSSNSAANKPSAAPAITKPSVRDRLLGDK